MDISTELADRVMRLVVSADYRPSKPKQIANELKLAPDEYRELRRVIKQLVLEGRLLYGSNHLVISTGAIGGPSDSIRGTFRRAMGGGFGFVRPNHAEDDSDMPEDVFIPAGCTAGAMEGDLVKIDIRPSRKGGNEGRVGRDRRLGYSQRIGQHQRRSVLGERASRRRRRDRVLPTRRDGRPG